MKIVDYELQVITNNFFMSNLLGELFKEENDRMGFILGHIVDKEISKVERDDSFSEDKHKKVIRKLCLQSFVFIPLLESIDNDNLEVDPKKVENLTSSKGDMQILGMFSYRPFSIHKISLREMSIFHQLKEKIVDERVLEKEQFLFLLFNLDNENLVSVTYTAMHSPVEEKKKEKEDEKKEKEQTDDSNGPDFFNDLQKIEMTISSIEEGIVYDTRGDESAGLFDQKLVLNILDEGAKQLEEYIGKELKEFKEMGMEISKLDSQISEKEKLLMIKNKK